ncbi:hypothetical protein [Novosphingobium mangrovi (ex Huang et al. 2023)]|uniref:Roadblock/LAMTOR2 domain-containing protein n=1 Tax=Novosphingobium mangrovi (ex Huang et al. 2023) TaxID=2976432 RepID=A0ABT2I056_9SPHN|nr:hypothetical protein [Novosphingobium mangrovi (ex Huang et al. 2023)]MCT2398186.1 hypothetical protein [Novosphingobium mangrovi (ex Huang et al. 2023)]
MNGRVPEPEVWTARLRGLVHDCVASTSHEEADRVREAAHLLHSGAMAGTCGQAVDPSAVESMLACGAAESAVLEIVGHNAAFMLSRGQSDCCLATVIVGDEGQEVMSEGATLALALLGAYAGGLLAAFERDGIVSCALSSRPH